jgi:hypothetical protein
MPLEHSSSKPAFKKNVDTLMHEIGKSPHVKNQKQALAVAYSTQRRAEGRAMGGVAPSPMMGQAMGGLGQPMPPMPNQVPPQMPMQPQGAGVAPPVMGPPASGITSPMGSGTPPRPFAFGGGVSPITKTFKGPIVSSVPGRTDNHSGHVASGSYVIPADIVSAHGQGNSLAGMNALHQKFRMGSNNSMGTQLPFGGNRLAKGYKLAKGGQAEQHVGKPVKVRLAGGELVLPPENVLETMCRLHKKKMSLDECHKKMDEWVVNERKKLVKTLKRLPGPAQD